MKLPIEVSQQMYASSNISLGYEAIVRDCAKAYDEWRTLDHFKVGDFPQYLADRYGLEPK